MRPININLAGAKPATRLAAVPELDLDLIISFVPAVLACLVALVAPKIVGTVFDSFVISGLQRSIDETNQRIGANKGKAKELQTIQNEAIQLEEDARAMLGVVQSEQGWQDVLEEVRILTPTSLWLRGLKIEKSHLVLEGAALDYRDIAYFVTNFQNSPRFVQPVLGDLSASVSGTQTVIEFKLECNVVQGGS
ncbi:MAG: PilN domain-containing protein [bacterium]|nr:PilN domain-containing protein [bacterium]